MKRLSLILTGIFVLFGCNGVEEETYQVHFNTFQGEPMESVSFDDALENIGEPVRTGFVFEGWYFDHQLNTPFDQETLETYYQDEEVGDITLYASWSPIFSYSSYDDGYVIRGFFGDSVESLVIPEKIDGRPVYVIGKEAFEDDDVIRDVTIPESVIRIEEGAFRNSSISSLTFEGESSLETIELHAFAYTSRLTEVEIPGSVIELSNGIFVDSRVSKITFGEGASIEVLNGFQGMKYLQSIVVPASVKDIPVFALSRSDRLETVIFEENSQLEVIGHHAFYGPNLLREIHLPASLTIIGERAFMDNTRLHTVTFEEGSQLEVIGDLAFRNARSLKEITIPASVKHIGANAFRVSTIGSLEKVTFEEGSQLETIDHGAFANTPIKGEIDIPDSVTGIGSDAFRHSTVKAVNFGENSQLVTIGEYAFRSSYIERFTLPQHVENIGLNAFYNTYFLEEFSFGSNVLFKDLTHQMFMENGAIEHLIVPDHVRSTGYLTFSEMTSLKRIEFGTGFYQLYPTTFQHSANLETVIFHRTDSIVQLEPRHNEALSPFKGVSENLTIYVPDELYDDYMSNENWSYYTDYIEKLSNYPA